MRFTQPSLLVASLLLSLSSPTAEASLAAYNANGVNLVRVQNIGVDVTWTADGNLLGTLEASNSGLVSTIISTIGSISDTQNFFDTPIGSYSGTHTLTTADFGVNGLVSWFGAQAYVSYLNTINYAGSHQWALPGAGDNQTVSEFVQLYYFELNALAFPGHDGHDYGILGNGQSGTSGTAGPFSNVHTSGYWLGTEYSPLPDDAWAFGTALGEGAFVDKDNMIYAWAISPEQVSAVPVPAAVWLFGTGLVGLLGLKTRLLRESWIADRNLEPFQIEPLQQPLNRGVAIFE